MSARDFDEWHLPHMRNCPNDMILYNRELSEAANWLRQGCSGNCNQGRSPCDCDGYDVTSTGHLAVLVVSVVGTVAVVLALLAGLL